ncbi:type II toxin-antitoxin system RelE/ParE family toxin [Candidatus Acetothermia bacterium]|nr:type II toxin-antitoxin system RelE/ParE family toxin [Candidatus Acetothermia bacterium]MCI2431534.1 type II toxin-antitoxin system RelE/ParE family toxin [Candidatus Acetothermia bacterium]MCI2436204.1 type II toxin-antitoxin system RelE/ParE family toxin [Candidatus Acetothermia bacterium]
MEAWLQELPLTDRAKIAAVLAEIEELGFQAIGCDFRQVKGKLWELKIRAPSGAFRIFYVIVTGPEMILLHALRKGARKIPKKDLQLAIKRMEEI